MDADPELGRFAYHKAAADRLVTKMLSEDAGLYDRAARLAACSEQLLFSPTGRYLGPTRSCGQRLCPSCQARKARRWGKRLREALPALTAAPGPYVFLTLTQRNVPLPELRQELRRIYNALHNLTKRAEWAPLGGIRTTEVTVNAAAQTAHPHVHLLLRMPAGYGPRSPARWEAPPGGGRPRVVAGYMSQKRLRELWAEALGLDYDPQVDVRLVRWRDAADQQQVLLEIGKYGVKPSELTGLSPHQLAQLFEQLAGTRTYSTFGDAAPIFADLERARRWSREYEKLERIGRRPGPAEQRQLAEVASWNGRRYDRHAIFLLPRDGSQLAADPPPAARVTGYVVRSLPPGPELGPMPAAETIGDVWHEPENFAWDLRAERLKCMELQRAKPERRYYFGPLSGVPPGG